MRNSCKKSTSLTLFKMADSPKALQQIFNLKPRQIKQIIKQLAKYFDSPKQINNFFAETFVYWRKACFIFKYSKQSKPPVYKELYSEYRNAVKSTNGEDSENKEQQVNYYDRLGFK